MAAAKEKRQEIIYLKISPIPTYVIIIAKGGAETASDATKRKRKVPIIPRKKGERKFRKKNTGS